MSSCIEVLHVQFHGGTAKCLKTDTGQMVSRLLFELGTAQSCDQQSLKVTEDEMAQSRSTNKKSKNEDVTSDAQSMNVGMRFALIYFAILFGMTFVFLAAPPAHSASAENSALIQPTK